MIRPFVVFLMAGLLIATSSLAEDNLESARNVIEQQIVAFLNDDVDSAYSYTAPGVQKNFPEPQRFFDMVKQRYAPVYRPGNYAFGRALGKSDGSAIAQELLITGPQGKNWQAVFMLERQGSGEYRISGVRLAAIKASSI